MSILGKNFTVGLADALDSAEAWRTARRICVAAEVLKSAKLCAGDALALVSAQSNASDASGSKNFAIGIAWPSLDLPVNSIEVSPSLLLTARLAEGDNVRIVPLASNTKIAAFLPLLRLAQEAMLVKLDEITPGLPAGIAEKSGEKGKGRAKDWLGMLLKECLVDLKYITDAQILEVTYEGRARRFAVKNISGPGASDDDDLASRLAPLSLENTPPTTTRPQLWTVGWDTTVSIQTPAPKAPPTPNAEAHKAEVEFLPTDAASDAYASVGGLDTQVAQIRDLLELPLTRPELFARFGLKPPRGVLLHGPPGTGKTHLARAVAQAAHASVIIINGPELSSAYHGETEGRLRGVFEEARQKSPCVVVLDEVDALCPRRDDGGGGEVERRVVATLLTLLDGFDADAAGAARVVVVATTNRPHALDPALRRPGRFDTEIEVGIPDAAARHAILRVLLAKTPHAASDADLGAVARRAHGYVGADLGAVVREAGTRAIKRWLAAGAPASGPSDGAAAEGEPEVTLDDLLGALPVVRASALRTLQATGGDVAPVHFSDIGGLARVVQALRECVEWPLKHPEAFARLGVKAPRGVLLYGPPGCSKTMLVRALACESSVNFVSIKGPELLSKYVGDSERAVRDLFRKARGAVPCIVFFDEIDALASARASGGSAPAEGVLTSLLTEMDGVRELGVGVTVVAATNRPEAIDGALLRPGRLDRIIYVGPPDVDGRAEILGIRMRGMRVAPEVNVRALAELTEGCSGAELGALCQEAALLTMKRDMDAPHVPQEAFVEAAKAVSRQITPEVVAGYERWRARSGAASA